MGHAFAPIESFTRLIIACCAIAAAGLTAPVRVRAQTFTTTGGMEYARNGHQATLLLDGRILVTGGAGKSGEAIARAEVFVPATETWVLTGSILTPRLGHAAALLSDGRVLIVGGTSSSSSCASVGTAEAYDPATGEWSPVAPPPMAVGTGAIAARLLDGRVLVAGGGNGCDQAVNTAALFDPATNIWSTTASMATARQGHRSLLLADGRVLVADGAPVVGSSVTDAEVFDPVSATWAGAAGPFDAAVLSQLGVLDSGRTFASITALADGRVLAAGGYDESATLLASTAQRMWAGTVRATSSWPTGTAHALSLAVFPAKSKQTGRRLRDHAGRPVADASFQPVRSAGGGVIQRIRSRKKFAITAPSNLRTIRRSVRRGRLPVDDDGERRHRSRPHRHGEQKTLTVWRRVPVGW